MLRETMEGEGVDTFLVFSPSNLRYLTGFTGGEGVVVVTGNEALLVSDSRYTLQAREEAPFARFVEVNEPLREALPEIVSLDGTVVGVESGWLTVAQWELLRPALEGVTWRLVDGMVERLRLIKDEGEIELLRKAGALAATACSFLVQGEMEGRTEADIALDLEYRIRGLGSELVPFPLVVAAGERSAMPHAVPTCLKVERGGLLLADFGAVMGGYASDMTRTFAVGLVDDGVKRMYEAVQEAQAEALASVCPGIGASEVDSVARGVLARRGLDHLFQHSLGHGVGLDVHEAPRVNQKSAEVLEAGMVVTIEPGVYMPGVGGVRIEDTILVTSDGAEILTEFPRDFHIVT